MKKHNENCKICKIRIFELLSNIYGEVYQNHNLNLPVRIEDIDANEFSPFLKNVFEELQNFRGYTKFVKSKKLKPVDYFIKDPGFILEFDESQHFTKPREFSLGHYPSNLKIGFNISKWKELCVNLNKRDNHPVHRDEQRAWFDLLRDFAPVILDLKPTKRLFAKDYIWCSLDCNNDKDINTFKSILTENE